jgi:hypothetical protein
MKLPDVVPWGRSLAEYRGMFDLSESDMESTILGCADGPASFNAELNALGGDVVSVDPVYRFRAGQLRTRIDAVYREIMPQVIAHREKYAWNSISGPEQLGQVRMSAMNAFLDDYVQGRQQGRYIEASLPDLPFSDHHFELALCSHFLFLYSEQFTLEQHVASLRDLCRVAREVRVYPLLTLSGQPSPYLKQAQKSLQDCGFDVRLAPVDYEFQIGATEMLVIHSGVS